MKIADELLLPCDMHHPAITVSNEISDKPSHFKYNTFYYDFKKGDYAALNDYFHNVDWDSLLNNMSDIHQALKIFYEILFEGINKYIPLAV